MKRIIFTLLLLGITWVTASAQSATVKLKITYNGQGLANNLVTVKYGDNEVGSGTTNSSGDVTIRCSPFLSRSIDLKGENNTADAQRRWSMTGMVELDNNNYAHVKMEEVVALLSQESGMSESLLAEAWGLTYSTGGGGGGGSSNSGSSSSNSGSNSRNNDDDDDMVAAPPKPVNNYKCEPASDAEYNDILSSIKGETFDMSKTENAERTVRSTCLTSKQVRGIIDLLGFGNDKLKVAKAGYARSADPSAYYRTVSPGLTMQLDRDELAEYIDESGSSGDDDGGDGDVVINLPPPKTPEQLEAERLERERREAEREAEKAKREEEQAQKKEENERERSNIRDYDMTVFAEGGEKFTVFIESKQMNETPTANYQFKYNYATGLLDFRIVFENPDIPAISKKVMITNLSTTYKLKITKNNQGEYVLRVDVL